MKSKIKHPRSKWYLWLSVAFVWVACEYVPIDPVENILGNTTDSGKNNCGNGLVDIEEECDDGVNDGGEGECQPGCVLTSAPNCGNGLVDIEEECDDGVNDGGEGECQPGCVLASAPNCGNGVLEENLGERCDDSNTTSLDGCSSNCAKECGFACETPGALCQPDCDNLIYLSCYSGPAIALCCQNDIPEGMTEEDCNTIEEPISIDMIKAQTYQFDVDRIVENPNYESPNDILEEADYTAVSNGNSYLVTFSEDGQKIAIDYDNLTGTLETQTGSKKTYLIDSGFFAGGRFTALVNGKSFEAELTEFGSGVPIIASERGNMIMVTVDFL